MNIDAYCTIGVDREYDLTPEQLLRDMDTAMVDMAVITPVDRYLAVNNQEGNDYILSVAAEYKSKFIPACTASPWLGQQAVEEIKRALSKGARMIVLHPFLQGFQANDELVFPLLECAVELKVPVYIHSGMPGNSTPWQIVDVADKFPEADIIMGHCGATDFWYDLVNAVKAVKNICIEASLARPFMFANYLGSVGKEKGLMGSYAPINKLSFEWAQMRKNLPEAHAGGVYGDNLKKLLEKRGAL
jgi:uncharacterized protein